MLLNICAFEIKKRLRQASTYLYMALFFAITLLFFLYAGGAFSGSTLSVGAQREFVNAPGTLHQLFIAVNILQMMVVAAIFGQAVYQDFPSGMYLVLFTRPISKWSYLGGRFLAALFICSLISLAIPCGALIAALLPFVDHNLFAPVNLTAYLWPVISSLWPNVLIVGSLFFALATLSRRITPA